MKKRILVVDDDLAILKLLKFTLTSSGFEVHLAKNDEEFRRKATNSKPDVIVLDLMLGEKDGVEIYEELLRKDLSPKVPVVFLSVLAQDVSPTPPQPGRKYAIVPKPFDPEKLAKEIARLVRHK